MEWTASSMGKKGGKSMSPSKVAAVRRNGRKGGRPRIWPVEMSPADIRHVRMVAGCRTLEQFRETCKLHAEWRNEDPQNEPCFECKAIARKIGFPI